MKKLKLFFALFAMLALGVGNAWAEEYELYSGTITEGDYVIVYEGGAMNTTVTSSRLGYTDVTPNGNIITDPAAVIVWHIAPSGEYWTIYSASANKYAASTGAKNKAQLLDDGTNDKSLWTVTGTETYEFVNKQNAANDVNKNLRRNTTYGFACYATSTGGALSLYKKVENAGATTKPVIPGSQEFETETFTVEMSAEEGAAIYYTLDGTDPTEASTAYTAAFTINATTTIKAIAVKDGVSSSVASATYTKVNTIDATCEEAVEKCNEVGSTGTTDKYRVQGYVTEIVYAYDSGYKNVTFWMAGTKDGGQQLEAYRVTPTVDGDEKVKVGDKVEVVGKLVLYGSTNPVPEFIQGSTYTIKEAATVYNVTIVSEHGTVTADPMSGIEGTEVTLTVEPAYSWVFDSWTVKDESNNDVAVADNKFTIPASNVTVTANYTASEAPDAVLILMANTQEHSKNTYKVGESVDLPATIENDCSKVFVGWSADANCATEPEYAPGAEFKLTAEEHTLYAVYASGTTGETVTIKHNSTATTNMTGDNDANTFFGLDATAWSIVAEKGSASNNVGINKDGTIRLYYHVSGGNTLTVTAPSKVATIKLTYNGTYTNAWVKVDGNIVEPIDGVYEINANTFVIGNANTSNVQVHILQIDVTLAGNYSNYSTTCSAALANPTFSLTEGKYTEAKSVEITATEGTVYYTLDGSEPTAASTQYTGAIALNDCGEHTIKAVAISADSQSEVVEATYTIKLPIESVSAADPYTEAEAKEVYNSGCYDEQEVYVKGTVKSAAFNSTYGNYTITLTDGFQFYQFHAGADKEKFSENIIVPGDVLVACGKLSEYNGNCQLAAGCYLVERIPYEGEKTDISNTEATAYTVDQAFALIADVTSDLTKEVYVKGIVAVAPTSNPTDAGKMTYSISDNGANTGNVLKVYLGLGLNGAAFTSKDDVKQGDYVVAKGKLLDYSGTYELIDNQLVQHIPAATITIADITMEVGDTKTIAATITPAAAESAITYSIKENTANAISLSGNVITANAVGTATITATIATAADYMGKTVDFTVTVNAKSTKEKVVILAEYEGQWYAMKAQYVTGRTSHLAPLPVTYFDGKLYNVNEADKALIEWERAVVDGKATFYNDSKYLTGKSDKTDLTLAATACEWTISGDSYLIGSRTFLYNAENNWFRNFGTSNVGNKNYSGMPVVTAPVYATAIEIGSGDNTTVIEANKNQKVNVIVDRAFEAGEEWYTLCVPFSMQASLIGTAYQLSGLVQKDADYVEVNLAAKNTIEAGKPYLVKPNVTVSKFVVENVTIVNTTGESIAKSIEGLSVEMQGVINGSGTTGGLYWVGNSGYLYNDDVAKLGLRTYFNITTPSGIAPRMRVVAGENVETGVEDLFKTDAPVKVIENGQLIIIRDGVKYNVQGQKL